MSLVRRLWPVLALALALGGYLGWRHWRESRQQQEQERLAQVLARVWVASAVDRYDVQRFLTRRDSILQASGVQRDEYFAFLERYRDHPARLLPFTRRVRELVDSLVAVEDSLIRLRQAADSSDTAAAADSTGN